MRRARSSLLAARRATIESALASWTYARHAGQPLSRARPARARPAVRELQVTGAPLPAFVEAAPDVIARLVGDARSDEARVRRDRQRLPATSPAMITLAEVEDILRVALRIATHMANDEALAAEDLAALASLPARLASLEEPGTTASCRACRSWPRSSRTPPAHRVLSTATGPIEPAVMIVREPGTGRLFMAVGAHVAHHDLVEARGRQTTEMIAREARPWRRLREAHTRRLSASCGDAPRCAGV